MAAPCGTEALVEVLYRCEVCGKWSHAKRRPRWHERFIPHGIMRERATLPILRDANGLGPRSVGFDLSAGVWVSCGPFARWNATRVEFRD